MKLYKYHFYLLAIVLIVVGLINSDIARKEDAIYIGQFLVLSFGIFNIRSNQLLKLSFYFLLMADLSYYLLVYRSNLSTESPSVVFISSILYFLTFICFTVFLVQSSRGALKSTFSKRSELSISFFFILTALYFIIVPATQKLFATGPTLGHLSNVITLASSLPLSIVSYLYLSNHNNSKNYPVLIGFFVLAVLDMGIQLETIRFGDLRFTYYDYFWFFGVTLLSIGAKDFDISKASIERGTSVVTVVKNAFFICALGAVILIGLFAGEKFESPMYLIFLLVSIFVFGVVLSTLVNSQMVKYNAAIKNMLTENNLELTDIIGSSPVEFSDSFLDIYKVLSDKSSSQLEDERSKLSATAGVYRRMAHDIASPLAVLNVIGSRAQFDDQTISLLKDATARVRNIAKDIVENGTRSIEQVERVEKTLKVEQINEIIVRIVAEKEAEFSKHFPGVKLSFRPKATNSTVYARKVELERVISNLLNNSLEVLNGIGASQITVDIRDLDQFVELSIADNGPGFNPIILNENFQNPISVGKAHGNGLGLFSAFKTLQKWNGKVVLTNDSGATVKLCLRKVSLVFGPELSELHKVLNEFPQS